MIPTNFQQFYLFRARSDGVFGFLLLGRVCSETSDAKNISPRDQNGPAG